MASYIGRRKFLATLGGAAAWPLAASAQQPEQMRRVGVLQALDANDPVAKSSFAAFTHGLQESGWTEGLNLRIDQRWAAGNTGRLLADAVELVRLRPDVILAGGSPGLTAAQRASRIIPIVFINVADPVGQGFIPSLARPGGNATGFTNFEFAMGGKWLGVLKEAAPNMERAAVLFGSDIAVNIAYLRAAEAVAPSLGLQVAPIDHAGVEIERAISTFASQPDGGLVVLPNPNTTANRSSVIILAARHRLPAIYPFRFFATEGGLMSYGIDQIDQWRGAATYVDRVLRGEKPGDLPVQAPTKFELVVNLKTAKAIGLHIPPAFPLRADEVIE